MTSTQRNYLISKLTRGRIDLAVILAIDCGRRIWHLEDAGVTLVFVLGLLAADVMKVWRTYLEMSIEDEPL